MEPGVVLHTFNPRTQEAEGGRSLWVQGQPGLYGETLSQKKKKPTQQQKEKKRKHDFQIDLLFLVQIGWYRLFLLYYCTIKIKC